MPVAAEVTVPELAKELGTSRQTIARWVRFLGLETRVEPRKSSYTRLLTTDQAQQIRHQFRFLAPGWNFRGETRSIK